MVKIDMGVHVDGYIVLVAHTCIVGMDISTPEAALSIANGPRSNVINAAYTAAEVASRLIKNGNTNAMVTQAMKSVAELFGCDTIGGTVMHQMKQFVIDGSKMVLLKDDPEQKVRLLPPPPLPLPLTLQTLLLLLPSPPSSNPASSSPLPCLI